MSTFLVLTVRISDGRYHGVGDWPPSPARLFQALVAGTARGTNLTELDRSALRWLEALAPPAIAAPKARKGQHYVNYVVNNHDLVATKGRWVRKGKEKTNKHVVPYLFDADTALLYVWSFEAPDEHINNAQRICAIADQLYQLGRGVDMAWAWGEVLNESEVERCLEQYGGAVYRPMQGGKGIMLDCPISGSLKSLKDRFAASRQRFSRVGEGKDAALLFSQAPKPRFGSIAYDSAPERRLFDLRTTLGDSPFSPWPLTRVTELVVSIRDKAVERLKQGMPHRAAEIERVLIGRDAAEADKATRVRIVPLPSAGHQHADRAVRRVLIEIPPNCSLKVDDVVWAFSSLVVTQKVDAETGELLEDSRLVPSDEHGMLRHYGVDTRESAQVWRTVTPAALPEHAARRRIDPRRQREGAKDGRERTREQHIAATAVLQALRHAGVSKPVDTIRVQREPFEARGARAEAFAKGTRFAKERLWHVEIAFSEPVKGPMILGDGRYMGLGLMTCVHGLEGVLCFAILDGLSERAEAALLAQALRRAVMSRVQSEIGERKRLPVFFTGHEPDGAPLRNGNHAHLAFAADLARNRLLIIAPHVLEGREATYAEREHLKDLETATADLNELRAGSGGLLKLARMAVHVEGDPLFASARIWESVTDYHPTRYGKRMDKKETLAADVRSEVLKRGIALPAQIEVTELHEGPRGGLAGRLRLHFATAVNGLILIGRTRHVGGGLFSAAGR